MQLFATRFFIFPLISLFAFLFFLIHHPAKVATGTSGARVIVVFYGTEIAEKSHSYVVYAEKDNGDYNYFLQTHIIKLPIW